MYILVLESSTTSAKAMLYDTKNGTFEVKTKAYLFRHDDTTIHDAKAVFEQTAAIGRQLCEGKEIDIVVLSGTWHSLMLCNRKMEPQTPVYLWSYTGAAEICKELRKDETYVKNFYQKTGCMVNAIYPFFKIKLLKKQGHCLKDYYFAGQGTYNNYRLTGQRVVMDSMASGSGLLNTHTKQFDPELVEELGISTEQLPKLITYKDVLSLNQEGAELLGLKQGTPVIAAGPDGGLNQIGAGALNPGILSFSVGTSGALRLSTNAPLIPKEPGSWCYLSPKSWLSGAATSGCCNCIDWFKQKYFGRDVSYSEIEQGFHENGDTPVFLPFLYGERCPGWDDEREGAFFDIKPYHTPNDFYRAIQEGVLFNLFQCYEVLAQLNGKPKKVKLSGGILKSKLWTQMCADIFGVPMQEDQAEHSSLLGGVALAMEIMGELKDASEFLSESDTITMPNPDMKKFYAEKYQRYLYWYQKTK